MEKGRVFGKNNFFMGEIFKSGKKCRGKKRFPAEKVEKKTIRQPDMKESLKNSERKTKPKSSS